MVAPQTYVLKEALKEESVDLPPRTELAAVPFFPQIDYYCGPSSLAMVLQAAGVDVKPEALVDQVFLPGRKGSLQVEMLAAARRDGLIAYEIEPRVTDLLRELAAGTPAIVLENYGPFSWFPVWHYSVVVGYDLPELEVIRRSGTRARITTPFTIFEKIWKEEKYWAMVAIPPDRVPATANEARYTAAVVALEQTGQTRSAITAYDTLLKRWPGSLAAGWDGETPRTRCTIWPPPKILSARLPSIIRAQQRRSTTWHRCLPSAASSMKRCRRPNAR